MGTLLWARLEVRTADFLADKKLQKLMAAEGDTDSMNGVTDVTNPEASDGEMDDVEEYCMATGIAYDRSTEAGIESSAEMKIFRPGPEPISEVVFVNTYWQPTISCSEIFLILEDEDLDDKEKIRLAIKCTREYDFHCKLIREYLSSRETGN